MVVAMFAENSQYSLVIQFSQRGYVKTGVYNIESGQIKMVFLQTICLREEI